MTSAPGTKKNSCKVAAEWKGTEAARVALSFVRARKDHLEAVHHKELLCCCCARHIAVGVDTGSVEGCVLVSVHTTCNLWVRISVSSTEGQDLSDGGGVTLTDASLLVGRSDKIKPNESSFLVPCVQCLAAFHFYRQCVHNLYATEWGRYVTRVRIVGVVRSNEVPTRNMYRHASIVVFRKALVRGKPVVCSNRLEDAPHENLFRRLQSHEQ